MSPSVRLLPIYLTLPAKLPLHLDKEQSYYVGDAAGRIYSKTKKDFASTDRKWALNLDLKFFTPEEYFLGLNPNTTYELPGFNVSTLPERTSFLLPLSFTARRLTTRLA